MEARQECRPSRVRHRRRILYDTTCSFGVDEEDDEDGLRRFGHSKECWWTTQVVVASAVTREGLPVRSWVFPEQGLNKIEETLASHKDHRATS